MVFCLCEQNNRNSWTLWRNRTEAYVLREVERECKAGMPFLLPAPHGWEQYSCPANRWKYWDFLKRNSSPTFQFSLCLSGTGPGSFLLDSDQDTKLRQKRNHLRFLSVSLTGWVFRNIDQLKFSTFLQESTFDTLFSHKHLDTGKKKKLMNVSGLISHLNVDKSGYLQLLILDIHSICQ